MNKAFIVCGLGAGDEGKGTTVDVLAKEHGAHIVIRFNGGAQAAHNVVHDDGTHHTFNQFGSATFRGVKTHMTQHCLFDPIQLISEAAKLAAKGVTNPLSMFSVHRRARVVTPYHKFLNQVREIGRGITAHGSCGMGIGETVSMCINHPDAELHAHHLKRENIAFLRQQLYKIRTIVADEIEKILLNSASETDAISIITMASEFMTDGVFELIVDDFLMSDVSYQIVSNDFEKQLKAVEGNIICEGAQGVLLDEWLGFHPHTTWSTTLADNALDFLSGYSGTIIRIGVTRAYSTRHGNGPFPSHDPDMTEQLPDRENVTNRWQGNFKVGRLDMTLLKYAINMLKPDVLVVTCLDRIDGRIPLLTYDESILKRTKRESLTESSKIGKLLLWVNSTKQQQTLQSSSCSKATFLKFIEEMTGKEVAIVSNGPKASDKTFLHTKSGSLDKENIVKHNLYVNSGLHLR